MTITNPHYSQVKINVMELSQQCCSLEQAKKLKELGVNAPALNYYYEYICNSETTYPVIPLVNWNGYEFEEDDSLRSAIDGDSKNNVYPAYTVAELLTMMPHDIQNICLECELFEHTRLWAYPSIAAQAADTDAQSLAALLIHLLTHHLHTL